MGLMFRVCVLVSGEMIMCAGLAGRSCNEMVDKQESSSSLVVGDCQCFVCGHYSLVGQTTVCSPR